MAHPRHVHVFGGIYLVSAIGDHGQAVFVDDSDRAALGLLVAQVVERCGAQVHAFKWLPDELLMMLQVSAISIPAIVQRLGSAHARRINEKLGYKGSLFRHPHRKVLLEDAASILEALATIHREPASTWSSHRAYLGLEEIPWLNRQTMLELLSPIPDAQPAAYSSLMAREAPWARSLNAHSGQTPSAHAARPYDAFLGWLRARFADNARPASLDRLIRAVAEWFEVDMIAIESAANRPVLSLARALIVWTAMQNGIATLSELARRFGRARSTLHETRETYRLLAPELFNLPLEAILAGPSVAVAEVLRGLDAAKERTGRVSNSRRRDRVAD